MATVQQIIDRLRDFAEEGYADKELLVLCGANDVRTVSAAAVDESWSFGVVRINVRDHERERDYDPDFRRVAPELQSLVQQGMCYRCRRDGMIAYVGAVLHPSMAYPADDGFALGWIAWWDWSMGEPRLKHTHARWTMHGQQHLGTQTSHDLVEALPGCSWPPPICDPPTKTDSRFWQLMDELRAKAT